MEAFVEIIPGHDRYLDPPDYPTHSECDGCGSMEDNDDLTEIGGRWMCEYCKADYVDEWSG
jgi:hypothetical protein